MTQLDLPQISLQRYLELLKRRRWQVVPASLLGLLLGGIVAFFIPRYYVAETMLQHQMAPGMEAVRSKEDPFRTIVETAQITIPLAVGETIKVLGWPEASEADPYVRSEKERTIRSFLSVNDKNARPDRDYAQLQVVFKDLDGERAAKFLNTLVPIWIKQRLEQLREQQERERSFAADGYERANKAYEHLRAEKRTLEVQYGFDPELDPLLLRDEQRKRSNLQLERSQALAQQRIERATTRRLLEEAQAALDVTEKRRPVAKSPFGTGQGTEAKLPPELLQYQLQLQYHRRMQQNFLPHTKEHADATERIAQLEKLLAEFGQAAGISDGFEPNPEHEKLATTIAGYETELLRLEAGIAELEKTIANEVERLARLAEGYELYDRNQQMLEEARKQRESAFTALDRADKTLGRLLNQATVKQITEAFVPPRPTDPNILIVALLGCVLGLGFAIGLILLLDVLQGTWKTVDDVERGLGVPVLGGISFLETEVQRQTVQRRRRRSSLVAAAVLFLGVAVVTLYYVDPTRLPPVVRDLLALLLGA